MKLMIIFLLFFLVFLEFFLRKVTKAGKKKFKWLIDNEDEFPEFKKSKIAQDIQKAFPDAKLIDLKEEE